MNNVFALSAYNGYGKLSFTAGLRPVIKVKLDKIEKIDDQTKNEIINNSTEYEKNIIKEQESNSNNNTINYNYGEDNSKSDKTNNINNKSKINNYYNKYNSDAEIDKFARYMLVGLIILNILTFTQVLLSKIIFKKMKKK